jgi:hypothetical protein
MLKQGDVVEIEPYEKYFWQSAVTLDDVLYLVVGSNPPWKPEQSQVVG